MVKWFNNGREKSSKRIVEYTKEQYEASKKRRAEVLDKIREHNREIDTHIARARAKE